MNEVFIHYGHDKFEIEKFIPVCNITFRNKPLGGLWASPTIDKDVSWEDWCRDNEFRLELLEKSFKFKIRKDSNVLVVKSTSDVESLPRIKEYNSPLGIKPIMNEDIDFEEIAKHYDAMMVYMYRNEDENCWLNSIYQQLYGWDVDTLLVFNPEIIELE